MKTYQGWCGLLALLVSNFAAMAAPVERKDKKPQVEVVFCLDTTGSMGGLIEGAKQKIWMIVNQIASGRPNPEVKVGLVAYRDRGDAYVTQVFALTSDLDEVHQNIKKFSAGGGGDNPESVNQALDDSINKIKWTFDANTLRIVFLVGDAPPHMDYQDDIKYPETCKLASEKKIIINAIQCGTQKECTRVWQDVAAKAGGTFAKIAQNGGSQQIETPYDKDLAVLNSKLLKTNMCYGTEKEQATGNFKNNAAAALPTAGGVAADSAGFRAKQSRVASNDLLDDLQEGKKKLSDIKADELPPELKKLTEAERETLVKKLQTERDTLKKEALELDRKRMDFINKKLTEDKDKLKDAFDAQMLEMLRKQAEKAGIQY